MKRTVDYIDGKVVMIDQTRIPGELVTIELSNTQQIADAIKTMKVRGAPAIGVAAALGVALAAKSAPDTEDEFVDRVYRAADLLRKTRPTAVNLFWGIDKIIATLRTARNSNLPVAEIKQLIERCASDMIAQDEEICHAIGRNGAELMPEEGHVLTHCNAGALACVSYGTALGVIRAAIEMGKLIHVYADETRPRLQGMKLTGFELAQDDIAVTVIADNMAGTLMRKGRIDCVVVGADRIASNGDVANKIGTYPVAVLAHHHGIPFYVAAPTSTIDFSLQTGDDIPIEVRAREEMTHIEGHRIAPMGIEVLNPSFDVTPAALVRAIITEKGIAWPPYKQSLK